MYRGSRDREGGLKHSRAARESRGGLGRYPGGEEEWGGRVAIWKFEHDRWIFQSNTEYPSPRFTVRSVYAPPEGILKIQTTCRPVRGTKTGAKEVARPPFSSCPLDRVSSIDSTRAPGGTSALIRLLRDQRWRTCEDARLKRESKFRSPRKWQPLASRAISLYPYLVYEYFLFWHVTNIDNE